MKPEIPHEIDSPHGAFASVLPRAPIFAEPHYITLRMPKHHLVVARHKENVAWAAQHRGVWELSVVQKDLNLMGGVNETAAHHASGPPNAGREASSYLWWIVQHYDELADGDRIVFCQGHPYDHCPQFDSWLRSGIAFGPILYCDGDGFPDHPGLSASIKRGRAVFGLPNEWEIRFVAGAQFSVSGRRIKHRTKETWQAAYEWALEDPDAAWTFERLTCEVFAL